MNDKPRNLFRFRLKSMLVLMALISIVVSLIVNEFHDESRKKQMASEVVRRGGFVQFVRPSQKEHKATSVVNGWMTLLLGDKFFADVSAVDLKPGSADIYDFVRLFPEVKSLQVSGSDVTAGSLQLIGGLSQLENLFLSDAAVSNEQSLLSLTKLENLQSMQFENCTLSNESMSVFSKKSTLLRLTFVNCSFSNENLRALAEMDSLRNLSFIKCPINDTNLKSLYGPRSPVKLELDLNMTDVTEVGMLAIREANPAWCISFSGNYLPSIEEMPQVRKLFFHGALTTDATLATLKDANNLSSLSLNCSGEAITSVGLRSLHRLANLRELYLHVTKITITEAAEIAKLSSLEVLNVEDSSIDDGVFDELARMTWLKSIALGDTALSKDGIARLKQALPDCLIEAR